MATSEGKTTNAAERIVEFIKKNKLLRREILEITGMLGRLAAGLEIAVANAGKLPQNQQVVQAIIKARAGKRKQIARIAADLRRTFCRLTERGEPITFSNNTKLSELLFDQYLALNGELQGYLLEFMRVLIKNHGIEQECIEDKLREFKKEAFVMFEKILSFIKKVKVIERAATTK
jgi:hemerythrin superfamily protein